MITSKFVSVKTKELNLELQQMASKRKVATRWNKSYPLTGSPKSLVILVNFADKVFVTKNPQEAFTRLSSGNVSGSQFREINISAPITTSSQKIECQVLRRIICPPINGPAIGAIAITNTRVESICAARVRAKRSRIIARASIGPVQAPSA